MNAAIPNLDSRRCEAARSDPRLISSSHSGQMMFLDAIAKDGQVPMSRVYDNRYGAYRNFYASVADIDGGDFYYYYDTELGVPFIRQLFEPSRTIQFEPYVDPNETYKPHYYRNPLNVCGRGLTALRDSQFFRGDIMNGQIQKRNQSLPLYAVVD